MFSLQCWKYCRHAAMSGHWIGISQRSYVDSMLIQCWFDVLCPLGKVSLLLSYILSQMWTHISIVWSMFVTFILHAKLKILQARSDGWTLDRRRCNFMTMIRCWFSADSTFCAYWKGSIVIAIYIVYISTEWSMYVSFICYSYMFSVQCSKHRGHAAMNEHWIGVDASLWRWLDADPVLVRRSVPIEKGIIVIVKHTVLNVSTHEH